jgi:hypothetical protein
VKRDDVSGQRLKRILYVDLGAACDAYMKIWKTKIDKLLHKYKDSFARRRDASRVGAFIKGVDYEIRRTLTRETEHLF